MPIFDKHKILFIHIPKNAGTSVISVFGKSRSDHEKWPYFQKKHPKAWSNYTKVAIVRNPWDRAVSCFKYAQMKKSHWHSHDGGGIYGKHKDYHLLRNLKFPQAMKMLQKYPKQFKHQGWGNQWSYIMDSSGKLKVDVLLRYENLAEDFKKHFPHLELEWKNKSDRQADFRDYYDEHTKKIVANIYKRDIQLFKYTFDAKL